MTPNMKAAALAYAARFGWAVFPLHSIENGCCTCGKGAACKSPGKHPRTEHGLSDATTDPETIRSWWRQWPNANIAGATGQKSRFAALDVDPRNGGNVSLEEIEREHGPFPHTVTAHTGGGGEHRLFSINGPMTGSTPRPGIDLKADGGYIVLAPSVHISGKRYQWEASSRPGEVPLAPLNGFFQTASRKGPAPPIPEVIREGKRSETLVSLAGSMRRRGSSAEAILAALTIENKRCQPPLEDRELESIARSVARYPPEPLPDVAPMAEVQTETFSDLGNARRLVAMFGRRIRFNPSRGWMTYRNGVWCHDETGEVDRLAKESSARLWEQARAASDESRRTGLKWALASESVNRLRACVEVASTEPGIPVTPAELDRDPLLVNATNGTVDLRTGLLLPHDPAALHTKQTGAAYIPNTPAPTWTAFLQKVLGDDPELVSFFKRACGYALSGLTVEQVLFLLFGHGANGKTTALEALRKVFGSYSEAAAFDTFLQRDRGGIPNDIARLHGARFVTASEAPEGARLNESLVKQLTGGDVVTARFLHREFFEFSPSFKLFLACNHKPRVRGTDHGLWRRVLLVPFTVTIPAEEQDRDLPAKLAAEAAGILSWCVEGFFEYERDGLKPPRIVRAATADYRQESDSLGEFLADCCDVGEGFSTSAGALFAAFSKWCETEGTHPLGQRALGLRLQERGFTSKRTESERRWLGLRVKTGRHDA